jgi:nucleoside-diphosphate-sugar epimerase
LLCLPLLSLLKGVDWVFHLAARAGVRASWGGEFVHYMDANVYATQRLLTAAAYARDIQRFVYSSSSSVYGEADVLPVHETSALLPQSPYGVTKVASELLCLLYSRSYGVPVVALRYFTVYGPRQRPDMAFYRFCKALITGQPLCVYGDGSQTRDFTYVSDVVEANILAATSPSAVGGIFNIAGGTRVSLREVIAMLEEISQAPLPVIFTEKQRGDVRDTFADITQAERVLGYRPQVTLREGLQRELQDVHAYARSLTPRAEIPWPLL